MIGSPVQDKVAPALLSCMSQSAASPSIQRTAIKALRKMMLTPEVGSPEIRQIRNQLPPLLQHGVMMTEQLWRGSQLALLLCKTNSWSSAVNIKQHRCELSLKWNIHLCFKSVYIPVLPQAPAPVFTFSIASLVWNQSQTDLAKQSWNSGECQSL